jgi:phage terminase small subunit
MALTRKQQRFVEEYGVDWNATQAAIRAGYRAKRADQIGYENLRKPEIQAAIAQRQQALAGQCAVTQERVVQELACIAFSDLRTFVAWGSDGVRLEPSATLTPAHSRVVKQVVETVTKEGKTLRIQLRDKIAALDKLARHLGLYTGHEAAALGQGLASLLEASREQLSRKLDEMAARNGHDGAAR